MTTALVLPEHAGEVSAVETSTSALVALAERYQVASPEAMAYGTDLLAQIKAVAKRSEEARKVLVKPLNDHVAMINAQFKAVTGPLDLAERTVKSRMVRYTAEVERAAREEAQRLHREAQERALAEAVELDAAGKTTAADAALSLAADTKTAPAPRAAAMTTAAGNMASVRKTWEFEVVDFGALDDRYKVVNDVALREAVRAGVREIAGCRIYQRDSVVIR